MGKPWSLYLTSELNTGPGLVTTCEVWACQGRPAFAGGVQGQKGEVGTVVPDPQLREARGAGE